MSIFEVINICISILVLVVTTLGVGYAGLQLKRTKEIHLENLIWLRKVEAKNALTVRDYDGYLLAKELDYINATQPIPWKYILEKIEKDLKVQNELHKYLNFLSRLAQGVTNGIYDENVVKLSKGQVMIRAMRNFSEYIEYRRSLESSRSKAWWELEKLVTKWKLEYENQW